MVVQLTLSQLRTRCQPAQIVAVSKLQSTEKIRQLYDQGHFVFGENYVQELLEKIEELKGCEKIQWHLIGHLQRNKVKLVVGKVALIHSVDSLRLAQEIDKQALKLHLRQKILLQVNIAGESSKEGFDSESLHRSWSELTSLKNIEIMGFMTMPPLNEDPEKNRPFFKKLKEIYNQLKRETNLTYHPLTELSMGTSHDYLVAIEEGASLVRLGTILFGERAS